MRKWIAVAACAIWMSACSVKVDSPQIQVDPKVDGDLAKVLPKCTATLPPELNGIVDSDQVILVQVEASGGIAPYRIFGTEAKFAAHTTVSRSYTNSGSSNIVKADFVEIRDSLGIPAACEFSVTVKPATNPSTLACAITATPASPHVNGVFALEVTASGGGGTYAFSNLSLGADGVIVQNLVPNGAQASAQAKYTASGSKTIAVTVGDGTDSVTCNKAMTVRPALSVSLAASPALIVTADNPIVLTATSAGFLGTPSYVFSTTESGITISTNGNIATVTSQNFAVHSSFVVAVTASSQGESAANQISLVFTAAPPVSCALNYPAGTYIVLDDIVFTMTASTNETVEISTFNAGTNGTVLSSTTSTRKVEYSTSGSKSLSATGVIHRTGGDVTCSATKSISINNVLACSVSTNPNPSYIDEYYVEEFYVDATVAANSGKGSPKIVDVYTASWAASDFEAWSTSNVLQWLAVFYWDGVFPVYVTVEDASGARATCSTTQYVQYYPYWWW